MYHDISLISSLRRKSLLAVSRPPSFQTKLAHLSSLFGMDETSGSLCSFCRYLDWGPDSIAASCSCWRLACWIGLAKLDKASARDGSKGKERTKAQNKRKLSTPAKPLKPWYLILAYDGTDFAGWQRQAEAELCESCAGCVWLFEVL